MIPKKNIKKLSNFFKSKKMSNQLLLNYILFLILFIGMIILTVIASFAYIYFTYDEVQLPNIYASQIIREDYKQIEALDVLNNDGFIEILDNDFKIVMEKNSDNNIGYKYRASEFFDKIYNTDWDKNKYHITSQTSTNKDFILIVGIPIKVFDYYNEAVYFEDNYNPDDAEVENIVYKKDYKKSRKSRRAIFWAFLFVFFISSMVLYSKLTSRTFVKPLKKLLEGVNRVKNGEYSTRVEIDSINEIGQLKDAFNLMAAKIQEETMLKEKSEENRKRMILDISHDLKNPLTSILGYSEFLLKNNDNLDEERLSLLKVINNNSKRANDLIQDLFHFSRVDSEDYELDIKNYDISEFMRELIAGYIPMIEDKGLEYEFEISEDYTIVSMDKKNLDRALSNLIVNSIKYNCEGTTIKIKVEEAEENVIITIEDNGIGIPVQLAEDIFEPFVRVDSARNSKTGGTGLGLAITKKIIEKHGGSIKLDRNYENGCRFIIKLIRQ